MKSAFLGLFLVSSLSMFAQTYNNKLDLCRNRNNYLENQTEKYKEVLKELHFEIYLLKKEKVELEEKLVHKFDYKKRAESLKPLSEDLYKSAEAMFKRKEYKGAEDICKLIIQYYPYTVAVLDARSLIDKIEGKLRE